MNSHRRRDFVGRLLLLKSRRDCGSCKMRVARLSLAIGDKR